jgi:hypothetical protein
MALVFEACALRDKSMISTSVHNQRSQLRPAGLWHHNGQSSDDRFDIGSLPDDGACCSPASTLCSALGFSCAHSSNTFLLRRFALAFATNLCLQNDNLFKREFSSASSPMLVTVPGGGEPATRQAPSSELRMQVAVTENLEPHISRRTEHYPPTKHKHTRLAQR